MYCTWICRANLFTCTHSIVNPVHINRRTCSWRTCVLAAHQHVHNVCEYQTMRVGRAHQKHNIICEAMLPLHTCVSNQRVHGPYMLCSYSFNMPTTLLAWNQLTHTHTWDSSKGHYFAFSGYTHAPTHTRRLAHRWFVMLHMYAIHILTHTLLSAMRRQQARARNTRNTEAKVHENTSCRL